MAFIILTFDHGRLGAGGGLGAHSVHKTIFEFCFMQWFEMLMIFLEFQDFMIFMKNFSW